MIYGTKYIIPAYIRSGLPSRRSNNDVGGDINLFEPSISIHYHYSKRTAKRATKRVKKQNPHLFCFLFIHLFFVCCFLKSFYSLKKFLRFYIKYFYYQQKRYIYGAKKKKYKKSKAYKNL